jgi:hypothetical protein
MTANELQAELQRAMLRGMDDALAFVARTLRELAYLPSTKALDGATALTLAAGAVDIAGRHAIASIRTETGAPANDQHH